MANTQVKKLGFLERLNAGKIIVGDGGFVFALEKRGYVKAGPWTPEVNVEHPEAVLQLHREFLRAGADVMQTLTFYASDDKLENRGNKAKDTYSGEAINNAACEMAKSVAGPAGALVAGGICQTPSYLDGRGKEVVQSEFRKQIKVFLAHDLDFLICEYFEHIEEMEWAIEVCKESGKPVAATMCIGPTGDVNGVSVADCAIRMTKAGACCIGVNCHFDPTTSLATVAVMKSACEGQGLKVHYMCQPLAYHTPDCGRQGFIDLPEFPFALEPRVVTRFEIQSYARQAYDLGVRYIGGCCGFEPYHVRAISEELAGERGHQAQGSAKHAPWGEGLKIHTKPFVRARACREYWENLKPASGRPYCPSLSHPTNLELHPGDKILRQSKEETSQAEQSEVISALKKVAQKEHQQHSGSCHKNGHGCH